VKYAQVSGFRPEAKADAVRPLRTVQVEPSAFADEWGRKPKSAIVVGLRLLSSNEEAIAESYAARRTDERFPGQISDESVDFYNRTITAWIVARVLCDPNDASKPHPTFPKAEDMVPEALTRAAITHLFDEFERLHIEHSQIQDEATDEDLMSLSVLLAQPNALDVMGVKQQARARRLLAFVLTELVEQLPDEFDPSPLPDA
jgi:hypothetical protein